MKYLKLFLIEVIIYGVLAAVSEFAGVQLVIEGFYNLYISFSLIVMLVLTVRWNYKSWVVIPMVMLGGYLSHRHDHALISYLLAVASMVSIFGLMKLYEIKWKFNKKYKFLLLYVISYLIFIAVWTLSAIMQGNDINFISMFMVHILNIILGSTIILMISSQKTILVRNIDKIINRAAEEAADTMEDTHESNND